MVACETHAPARTSETWTAEGWRAIQPAEFGKALAYQCQFCTDRPLRRTSHVEPPAVILNVDDHPATLYVRDRLLREHAYAVVNADTGRQAVDLARTLKPALILLDIHLPDGDGRDFCRELRHDAELRDIPIVLISATDAVSAEMAEAVGWGAADAFLHDPIEPEVLISVLRNALRAPKRVRPLVAASEVSPPG
jgi:CheY-like chemotaxis protein